MSSLGSFLRAWLGDGRGVCGEPQPVGASGIWRITNLFVDLYAARNGSTLTLFDTGMDPAGRPIDALLAAIDGGREDVAEVFLTHAHPDHVAGAGLFPHAKIFGGAADTPRLDGTFGRAKLAERVFRRMFPVDAITLTDPLPGPVGGSAQGSTQGAIKGPLELPVGDAGDSVLALPLPGDTPGAHAYLHRGVLMLGDVVDLRGGRLVPAHAFATDDGSANLRSLAGLPDTLARHDVTHVCASHGGVTPEGCARAWLEDVAARAARG
jgi:glyoxylase-like metal-dependent hydrolase (beta-lactamase superfamily II)